MRITLLCFILFFFAACSSGQKAGSDTVLVPADLQLTIGEGGGFTGQWSGYAVGPKGGVEHLSGRSLGADRESAGKLSPAQLKELWSLVGESSVMDNPEVKQSGNMTRSLAITANGKSVANSWPVSSPAVPSLDSLYSAIYSHIQNAVRTH